MTPLAMKYIRALVRPDLGGLLDPHGAAGEVLEAMGSAHFFECTEAHSIGDQIQALPIEALEERFFLPAPVTWLEWRNGPQRSGLLLRQDNDKCIDIYRLKPEGFAFFGKLPDGTFRNSHIMSGTDTKTIGTVALVTLVLLAIINTPRLISRRQHRPHRGLQRELKRDQATAAIELRPWTEIMLEVNLEGSSDVGPQRLTGKKCLHFCRSHLRVQNGKIVVVTAHWRGDAALGIKQATYRVAA